MYVALLQYTGLMMSCLIDYPALLSFATGTSIAFIFLRGPRVLLGIALGTFIAYFSVISQFTIALCITGCVAANTWLLLACCHAWVTPNLIFHHKNSFIKFLLLASVLTLLTNLVISYLLGGNVLYFLRIWFADINGLLVFSLAIVTWDAVFPEISSLRHLKKWPLACCYGLLLFTGLMLWLSNNLYQVLCSYLLIPPLLMLLAKRWHKNGMIVGLFTLGFMINLAAYFAAPLLIKNAYSTLFILQLLIAFSSFFGHLLVIKSA